VRGQIRVIETAPAIKPSATDRMLLERGHCGRDSKNRREPPLAVLLARVRWQQARDFQRNNAAAAVLCRILKSHLAQRRFASCDAAKIAHLMSVRL
jgi:hypothetical protein